ncbi:MAG: hypothetical protein NTNFB02_34990 [Nitrospira sp.]
MSAADPVMCARSLIREYQLRSPIEIDVEGLAALRGAIVRRERLVGCEGRLVKRGNHGIISVRADIAEIGRERFTIAHELGHFELNHSSAELMICADNDLQPWNNKSKTIETLANLFAAELLMPEVMFKPFCLKEEPSLALIDNLADEFRTSLQATALRYVGFSPHRVAIVVSREDRIEWFKASDDFGFFIERGKKLDFNSLASAFFSGGQLSTDMRVVPTGAWIDDRRASSRVRILEQSKGFKNYGFVLSLLWIDESQDDELDEDDEFGEEERWS